MNTPLIQVQRRTRVAEGSQEARLRTEGQIGVKEDEKERERRRERKGVCTVGGRWINSGNVNEKRDGPRETRQKRK